MDNLSSMRPAPSRPGRRLAAGLLALALAACAAPAQTPPAPAAPAGPVRIVGANGREVVFAGVWEARPEGILVVTTADAAPSFVLWEKIDLARLAADQPALDAARQRAVFLRSPQPVNLGLFAGILTPAQAGDELRRLLDQPVTLKVPQRLRTTSTTRTTGGGTIVIRPPRPVVYDGIVIAPPVATAPVVTQTQKTVTETSLSPDELTTSPRRVLAALARVERASMDDRRALLELVKDNPVLMESTAAGIERIAASLPPRHLLHEDSPLQGVDIRLRTHSVALRAVTTATSLGSIDQPAIRELLALAERPSAQ